MAKANTKLDDVLDNVSEIEDFLHALLPALDERKLRQGDDVLGYAKAMKLKLPASLRGAEVTWETDHSGVQHARRGGSLVLTRPGHPDAVGLVIKCVRVRKWRICLECGWIWCRIVISRRF
jgi:hypothetical protein